MVASVAYSLKDFESYDGRPNRNGRNWRFRCPSCGDTKPADSLHRSLSYDSTSGLYKCHRCNIQGIVRERWDHKLPPRLSQGTRINKKLRSAFHPTFSAKAEAAAYPEDACSEAEAPTRANGWRHKIGSCHHLEGTVGEDYLHERGISLETAKSSKVRFAPSFYGRPAILFPIRDNVGKLVAVQGRFVDGMEKTHGGLKTQTAGRRSLGVFATPHALTSAVVFTEAPLDAMSLAQCGLPAVALCGKDGCPDWLLKVCAYRHAWVAFDADEAGDLASDKLCAMLRGLGCNARRLRPEDAKDWNTMLELLGEWNLCEWLCDVRAAI